MSLSQERTTVLCIDDDTLILNTLRRELTRLAFNVAVLTANNGAEALKIIHEREIGIAFIDLIMPGMGGLDLTNEIRVMSPHTEMVVITADDEPSSVVAAMKAGATDYLTKPLDMQRLRTITGNLVERHQLARENRRLWLALREYREQAFSDRPIRILIAEDNDDDALIVRRLFENDTSGKYDIKRVSTARAFFPAYVGFNPDCIILDYKLPDATGDDILSKLRNGEGHMEVAVVVLTAYGNEHVTAAAMRSGASDFLVKSSLTGELLHRAVFGALEKMDLMRKVRRQEEETSKVIRTLEVKRDSLVYDAEHDPLTGILNRRGMENHMHDMLHRQGTPKAAISLAMCDIDLFKNVNDKYGHQVGDEILQGVARRLQRGLRGEDKVSRYGGEEFLLMVSNSEVKSEPYERLRRAIARKPFSTRAGTIPITLSIGVAVSVPNLDIGIALADSALYDAKSQGRNQVVVKYFRPSGY